MSKTISIHKRKKYTQHIGEQLQERSTALICPAVTSKNGLRNWIAAKSSSDANKGAAA